MLWFDMLHARQVLFEFERPWVKGTTYSRQSHGGLKDRNRECGSLYMPIERRTELFLDTGYVYI
jgi:hypothetical protein